MGRINSLASLSKCRNLRHLDLSLISEAIALSNFFLSISGLSKLQHLLFPRASVHEHGSIEVFNTWPKNLRTLGIKGGLHDRSLLSFHRIPTSLSTLSIDNCPHLSETSIYQFLDRVSPNLRNLAIQAPMPRLRRHELNDVLFYLPNLRILEVDIDLVLLFYLLRPSKRHGEPHPLRKLRLDAYGPTSELSETASSDMVYDAVDDNILPQLRVVEVNRRLGWQATPEARADFRDLDDLLTALAREDGERAWVSEARAGVRVFGSRW